METWGTIETSILRYAENRVKAIGNGFVSSADTQSILYRLMKEIKKPDLDEPNSEIMLYDCGVEGADYRDKIHYKILTKLCPFMTSCASSVRELDVRIIVGDNKLLGLVGIQTVFNRTTNRNIFAYDGITTTIYTSDENTLLFLKLYFS